MFKAGTRFRCTELTCNFCDELFHQESGKDTYETIHRHIIREHPNEVDDKYKCKYCKKIFLTIKQKRDHQRICKTSTDDIIYDEDEARAAGIGF